MAPSASMRMAKAGLLAGALLAAAVTANAAIAS